MKCFFLSRLIRDMGNPKDSCLESFFYKYIRALNYLSSIFDAISEELKQKEKKIEIFQTSTLSCCKMIKKYFLGFILRWEMNLLGVEKSKSDNNNKNKINVRN